MPEQQPDIEQRKTYRPTRLAWCQTTSGYVDEERCADYDDHDHYDLAVDDETGKPLYRIDPVGTTYLLPTGEVMRIRTYTDDVNVHPMIDDPIIPSYDYWSTAGGAATGVQEWHHDGGLIWDGSNLKPGVTRIVVGAPEGRVPVRSIYVRSNGEVWRLRDYTPNWLREEGAPDVQWAIQYPSGSNSAVSGMDALPEDARLVWVP